MRLSTRGDRRGIGVEAAVRLDRLHPLTPALLARPASSSWRQSIRSSLMSTVMVSPSPPGNGPSEKASGPTWPMTSPTIRRRTGRRHEAMVMPR